MEPGLEVRKLDLWAGKTPGEMWKMQRAELDRMVGTIFDPTRPHAFAKIRDPEAGAIPSKE